MDSVKNKVDIIRKVLDEIEEENRFTKVLRELPVNSQRDFKEFSPEQIYFAFIKYIIDQDNLPNNVHGIQIHMNRNNEICGYDLISLSSPKFKFSENIQIIWEE